MAHRGQERRLGAARVLGGQPRRDGVTLGALARGHVSLDRVRHVVERAGHLLELRHRADVHPPGVIAACDPARCSAECGKRTQHHAREDDHRRGAGEHDQHEDRDWPDEQALVVGAHVLDVAQGPLVHEVDEPLDRGHDHALLGEVGVVDEQPVVRVDIAEVVVVDPAVDALLHALHHPELEAREVVRFPSAALRAANSAGAKRAARSWSVSDSGLPYSTNPFPSASTRSQNELS